MAACGICKSEVETHRYVRAEPMRKDNAGNLAPVQLKVSGFYCLSHPLEQIAQAIMEQFPPSESIPIRLLWSPDPAVRTLHSYQFDEPHFIQTGDARCLKCGRAMANEIHAHGPGIGVTERLTRDGTHGVRTTVVTNEAGLHSQLPELVPSNVQWFVPHAGVSNPKEAAQLLANLFGGDDPVSQALLEKIKEL